MRSYRPRALVLAAVLTASLAASESDAQEGGTTIDLFDDQSSMSASTVAIESADGQPVGGDDEWDGTDSARVDGGISLEYERGGSGILVPAQVNGISVYFIFDTGASGTSLVPAFAKRAGITPKSSYPKIRLQTAAGPSTGSVGIIDNLNLGGRGHFGVTFHTCAGCPSGTYKGKPIVGLLGLNVLGRYRTSFDDSRGIIEMLPTGNYDDRRRDVEPWVDFEIDKGVKGDKFVKFEGTVKNVGPRRIKSLELEFRCSGGSPQRWSKGIGAFGSAKVSVTLKSGDCSRGPTRDVVSARW